MTVVAMIIGACLAMCVLTTSVWFGRGPRGRLAIRRSFHARAQWRVWLWAERAWKEADMRSDEAQRRRAITLGDASFVEQWCIRLGSRWEPGRGYTRVWVRRLLYGLRLAPRTFASWFWYVVCDRVLVNYAWHPGRYEGLGVNDSQLIAQALDAEDPDDSEGPYAIYAGPFPWSKDAAILTHVDEAGFFTYATYPTMPLAREQFVMARERVLADLPTCDVCGEVEDGLGDDWNDDLGAHRSCVLDMKRRGYAVTQ